MNYIAVRESDFYNFLSALAMDNPDILDATVTQMQENARTFRVLDEKTITTAEEGVVWVRV